MKQETPIEGASGSAYPQRLLNSSAVSFAYYWLPVLALCVTIFVFSHDSGSGPRGSRILGPLIRWLAPGASEVTVDRAVFAIRKAAHVTEFAALAILFWRARRKPRLDTTRPWNWKEAAFAFVFTVLYAASDEIHQSFVPTRTGCVADVFIDSIGAALGLLAVLAWGRLRRRW